MYKIISNFGVKVLLYVSVFTGLPDVGLNIVQKEKDSIQKPFFNSEDLVIPMSKTLNKYSVQQLDNTKGLSNSSVNTIFQDSENLLWIGTYDGLNRYDGKKFKIFRPELNNENSLSNQVILKVDEDETGLIWILTTSGIDSYNKKNNTFKHYFFSSKNKFTLSEGEFNMAINYSKKVFCAVKNWGIGFFNGERFRINAFKIQTYH